ncbi:TadE-like protein [Saccharopolyspora shandongensis]|uniref:TadE-like protein n=1 Tax=Saccharopolyspora shandongensis TaxID=418495 RepID=A0A1H3GDV0_9PSEU|nr:TadE/TadG family type IV pilus assembly protein [Saccharopolyspora shandongensis]SDY01215.1 TadE-like protein [Saccharopolyspora shandongensis]
MAVELAVLAPLALVLLVTVLQAGVWWHTRTLCLSAAQQGVQAARTVTGTARDARIAATDFLTRAGGLVGDPVVSAEADDRQARVRVTATAPLILPIPGLDRIEQEAHAAKERFTTPGQQP